MHDLPQEGRGYCSPGFQHRSCARPRRRRRAAPRRRRQSRRLCSQILPQRYYRATSSGNMRRARAGDSNDATANFWPDGESKRGAKHHNMPLRVQHMYQYLSQPVHASSLSVFRILFSICMYKQAQYFRDMFDEFEQSILVLPYPGLGWITPVGPSTGEFLLALNRYAAIFVGLGFCTEIATVVLATTFTYLFVLCESNHNNHYILICHVTALASLTCWGRWASVDYVLRIFRHRRSSRGQLLNPPPDVTIPYWNLLLFQFIFSVPYFYGAIAKMNEDWLFNAQARPKRCFEPVAAQPRSTTPRPQCGASLTAQAAPLLLAVVWCFPCSDCGVAACLCANFAACDRSKPPQPPCASTPHAL
eukprot:2281951-Pleurochrysis_carterae.AAC.1